jgi:hypothetical protein
LESFISQARIAEMLRHRTIVINTPLFVLDFGCFIILLDKAADAREFIKSKVDIEAKLFEAQLKPSTIEFIYVKINEDIDPTNGFLHFTHFSTNLSDYSLLLLQIARP